MNSLPDYRIRAAQALDDDRLGELLVEAFVSTYAKKLPEVVVTEARIRELREAGLKRERFPVLVVETEGQVVGTATLIPPSDPTTRAWSPGAWYIRHVAVDPRFHGTGAGNALMTGAEAYARERAGKRMELHVRREASGVARFYERRGYLREQDRDLDLRPEIFLEAFGLPL